MSVNREVYSPEELQRYRDAVTKAGETGYADWDAPYQYGGTVGAKDAALADAAARQAAAEGRAPILADPAAMDRARATQLAARNQQIQAANYYAAMAQGGGPSVAASQYAAASDQANRGYMAAAGAGRGPNALAGDQRAAMLQASQGGAQAAQAFGGARLGEQGTGMGGYMGAASAVNQADLARAGLSAKWATDQANSAIQQRGLNQQDANYYTGFGNQVNQLNQQGVTSGYAAQQAINNKTQAASKARQDLVNKQEAEYLKQIGTTFLKVAGS